MKNSVYLFFLVISTLACTEPYESPVISPETGYLVVEGAINSGDGVTDILLSRTIALESRESKFELGAEVKVEAEDNTSWLLAEEKEGHYKIDNLNLDTSKKYRLSIKTRTGKEYQSDFLTVTNNPPIDNVDWVREDDGIHISVKTHDPAGNTKYYKWDYTETWEDFPIFKRRLEYQVTRSSGRNPTETYEVVYRASDDGSGRFYDSTMFFCWKEHISDQLLLANTTALTKDEIKFPLAIIPQSSEKMNRLYSINVKQISLSKEAYEFSEVMKRNSESTGSIFDAQPATLYGNIHNINDPDEPVIGFMSICPIREKRIFIKRTEIDNWNYITSCITTIFENDNFIIQGWALRAYLPITVVNPPEVLFPSVPQFYAAPPKCVDCRLNGGLNDRPDYWPNIYL